MRGTHAMKDGDTLVIGEARLRAGFTPGHAGHIILEVTDISRSQGHGSF
jgi:hypothetical protein